jgi:ribose/xylose/arabinose/galactoside ABC-type transport system permease subunit
VRNLLNIGRQVSLIGIMAIGMTFVLIGREDRSLGRLHLRARPAWCAAC